MRNIYFKTLSIIILLIVWPGVLHSQVMRIPICKEFLESKEIYLLDNELDTMEFTTSNGDVFTFEALVRKNWPDKELIKIDSEKYRKQKDAKNKFYITLISEFFPTSDGSRLMQGIRIQKGITGKWAKKTNLLYWVNLNLSEIKNGILGERLIFATQSLKDILNNYTENSFRSWQLYKSEGYKSRLSTDTLYIRKNSLIPELRDSNKLKELYTHNFKIVTNLEWTDAIKERKEQILFLEITQNGNYFGIDMYSAKEGKIIISSYPWVGRGNNYSLDKLFFEKMF